MSYGYWKNRKQVGNADLAGKKDKISERNSEALE